MHTHPEQHYLHRAGWLRPAVLGANDGIVSTASLLIGIALSGAATEAIILAGIAGLVAGAMSMAAGEYVSVSSQSDIEKADLETERKALETFPEAETEELAKIYEKRGLTADMALDVARALMAHDALGAHARDEIGLTDIASARPLRAAVSSAASFAGGALLPLIAALVFERSYIAIAVAGLSILALALLGYVSAAAGGASKARAVARVIFWGAAAMAVTGLIGRLVGTVI